MAKLKKLTKDQKLRLVNSIICVILGNLLLAFGTAIFLTKLNIVSGGLSGIGPVHGRFRPRLKATALSAAFAADTRQTTVHSPLSTVHCPLSTVHSPLSI